MAMLWMCLAALSVLAAVFVAWPFLVGKNRDIDNELNREAANTDLYKSHIAELDASLERGDIESSVYDQLKAELGRSLLEDNQGNEGGVRKLNRGMGVLIALLIIVPAASLAFYYWHAPHSELALRDALVEQNRLARENPGALSPEEVTLTQDIVTKLESLLARSPDNINNRYLLARNLVTLQDFSGAIEAYQQILSVDPKQPQVLAEFGQTLFMASGSQMMPQVKILADSALALDPDNTLALSLAGITSYESKQYQEALTFWQKAVSLLGQDNPESEPLLAGIDNINKLIAEGGVQTDTPVQPQPQVNEQSGITVQVSLDDAVEYTDEQVVFIYARAWQGPKMPLAITKISASELPTSVTLTESMSMMDGMTIATVGDIELVARLSIDGSPSTKTGDWQASIGPISQTEFDQPYRLVIDSQL